MSSSADRVNYAEHLVQEYVRTRDTDVRDRIVRLHTGMVERIARRYAGLEPHEDLVQAGFLGLLNALNMFEPQKGVRFNTYATHLVAGSIKHHLRDKTKIIREPAWLQEVRHRVNRTAAQLQQEFGRGASPEEIANRTGLPKETVEEVLSTDDLFRVASLTAPPSSEEDDGEQFDLGDDGRDQISVEDRSVLENAFQQLRDLERTVLGLFHFEDLNQTEIAARLGISGNYVSHVLRQATARLRAIFANDDRVGRALMKSEGDPQTDVLCEETGAYMEAYLLARLDEECARASCNDSVVGFVHVRFDGLDSLSTFYGPTAVMSFLADAAEFLRAGVRRLDMVGRLGSTGFGIILPGAGESVASVRERLASRLTAWVRRSVGSSNSVRVMIGDAYYPANGRNAKRIVESIHLERLDEKKAA